MNHRTAPLRLSFRFLLSCLLTLSIALPATAERIVVPVADPGKPVILEADLPNSSISVESWNGNEVVIEFSGDADTGQVEEVDGRYRIPNTSMRFEAEADGNTVQLSSGWSGEDMEIRVQVPVRTSLRLSTINGEWLRVSGVEGHHELRAVNGSIEATDLAGSVVLSSQNGEVDVAFRSLSSERPSSFAAWNGDIEVALPAGVGADVRVQAMNGEILSDFPVELQPSEAETEREGDRFHYQHRQDVRFRIGQGGAELQFKSFNGDVVLQRAE